MGRAALEGSHQPSSPASESQQCVLKFARHAQERQPFTMGVSPSCSSQHSPEQQSAAATNTQGLEGASDPAEAGLAGAAAAAAPAPEEVAAVLADAMENVAAIENAAEALVAELDSASARIPAGGSLACRSGARIPAAASSSKAPTS